MTDKNNDAARIDQLRESAKNRILNFPLNVIEYNRADHKRGFLRDTVVLAQTETLLAISEELALMRQHLQNPQARTPPAPPAAPHSFISRAPTTGALTMRIEDGNGKAYEERR